MALCKQRTDLLNKNSLIPVLIRGKEKQITIMDWHHCEQPDELDDDFYNVKIALNGETVYAQSIDLEFK